MPLITSFERKETKEGKLQPTQVIAEYKVFERDGKRVFQIDTGGSSNRENPGKQSQTIQLSEESGRVLWRLLKDTYGFR